MKIKNLGKKLAVVTAASVASASAFAVDHSTELQKAVDEGVANYTLVVVGVITLAAVGFGIGMIVSAMRR